ncbi:MAG: glycosyltransferase family 4 protein [Bacteroidetes bacterium]|nr:glycosyltransferase family 4 protein [Bacteroidota bacterium]
MKVIFLDTYPVRRGSQVFFEELADALIDKGNEVKKVYLYQYDGSVTIKINSNDILLNASQKSLYEKFPTVQPKLLFKLEKIVNDFNPDIILLNGSRTLKYAAFAKPFFKQKTKLIYRIIDSVVFWNSSYLKQLYYRNIILKNIDAAIGVSKASLDDVKKLYNFKKKSTVIHRCFNANKVDLTNTSLIKDLIEFKGNNKVILFLGNLTQQKRPEKFIQTIKILQRKYSDCVGWIVGDGVLKQQMIDEIEKHNLSSKIQFWGYQKNVFPFISVADILLLTSDTEGLPGVTLEAGYLKVPTVCPNVGGVKEFINNDSIGIVTKDNKPETFADQVSFLLDNEAYRKEVGVNAKNKVIADFDMNIISNKYIDFFHQIIDSEKN